MPDYSLETLAAIGDTRHWLSVTIIASIWFLMVGNIIYLFLRQKKTIHE
jgi:hypothetical protein